MVWVLQEYLHSSTGDLFIVSALKSLYVPENVTAGKLIISFVIMYLPAQQESKIIVGKGTQPLYTPTH